MDSTRGSENQVTFAPDPTIIPNRPSILVSETDQKANDSSMAAFSRSQNTEKATALKRETITNDRPKSIILQKGLIGTITRLFMKLTGQGAKIKEMKEELN